MKEIKAALGPLRPTHPAPLCHTCHAALPPPSSCRCMKTVIFVVDGFERYTRKGKQQVLYYLLDVLQVRYGGTAVRAAAGSGRECCPRYTHTVLLRRRPQNIA